MYTMRDLDEARAAHAGIEERWANYTGNNPDKYEADRKTARRRVRAIERALKDNGTLPLTEQEALARKIDAMFPNAESKQVVEYQGKRYQRRFFPLEKSSSGEVTEWGNEWVEVVE